MDMREDKIFRYIERLANLIRNEMRSDGAEWGLQPVQLEALYYLSICNRYSDTPMGVTEYLGQTKGTVSQTLKVLEKKGLISKLQDKNDKRVTHLEITGDGRSLLERSVPPSKLISACEELGDHTNQEIVEALQKLLLAMQRINEMKAFGVCKSCKYNAKLSDGGFFCNLTQEPLAEVEVELVCREYEDNG